MKDDPKKIMPHPTRHARRSPPASPDLFHRFYDPDELGRAISQLAGRHVTDDEFAVPADESAIESPEDRNRLRCLQRIAADPRGPSRRSIVGSAAMVQALNALSETMPHFSPAIGLVARAALVSARTGTPLCLPPCVLLGEPGIGKTFALRRIAETVGADFALIPMNMTDALRLRGLNTAWRGAKMGRIAELLQSSASSPIVLLDEFDKAPGLDRAERPYDVWHSLLDGENARHFRDDFLEIELRADNIIWFASANDVSGLPAPILDRVIVLEIPRPSRQQLRVIIEGIYAACRESYGNILSEDLSEDVSKMLVRHNPRSIAQLLRLAVGYAAAEGRLCLRTEDVQSAKTLAAYKCFRSFHSGVGFVPQQHQY